MPLAPESAHPMLPSFLPSSLPMRYLGLAFAQRMTEAAQWQRYTAALVFFLLALAARFELTHVLPAQGFPFLTFFPAVLLSTYLAGLGPGLLASSLSFLAAWLFFIQPDRSIPLTGADMVALVFFSAILLIDCLVIHVMKSALARVNRTEQQLRESSQRLRLVLDNLYVYVGILDLDGTLREVNEESLLATELDRNDILGRPLWDASWWAGHATHQQHVRAAIKRASTGETARFDIEVVRSGQTYTIDFRVGPLREGNGQITALVASGVDVTARAVAMAALHASRKEAVSAAEEAQAERRVLDATFNAVPASIIVAGAHGRMLRMNNATHEIWGVAPFSETIQDYGQWKGWWADGSARHGQPVQAQEWGLARSLQGQTCHDLIEIEPFGRPNERLFTMVSSAPVLGADGQVVGGVMAQLDITDRIHAEKALNVANEQLREADRQKDEFLATLAHELRNPLAPIRAAAELIRLREPADASIQRARTVIERQVLHLTRLVDDLLDISRITQGTVQLQHDALDLCAVAQSAVDSVQSTLDAAGLTLRHASGQPSIPVRGDAIRLVQCVVNLLTNAAKFTPRGGCVNLRVAHEGGTVAIEVSDNGSGIAAASLERIFNLFVQERPSGLQGNTGLGIGLALTRKLVALHGGSVYATSAGPGQGSTFRIDLPTGDAPQTVAAPAARALLAESSSKRVMVVEDNRDAADLLAEMMEMMGFQVTVAYTGESALAAMEKNMPDAVLMDIGLPDMNGYEVCRRLRCLPAARQPVAIALTGWGNSDDRNRAAEAGFNGHLTKPAEPDQIVAMLNELLAASADQASA